MSLFSTIVLSALFFITSKASMPITMTCLSYIFDGIINFVSVSLLSNKISDIFILAVSSSYLIMQGTSSLILLILASLKSLWTIIIFKSLQSRNALSPIYVTPSGRPISVSPEW